MRKSFYFNIVMVELFLVGCGNNTTIPVSNLSPITSEKVLTFSEPETVVVKKNIKIHLVNNDDDYKRITLSTANPSDFDKFIDTIFGKESKIYTMEKIYNVDIELSCSSPSVYDAAYDTIYYKIRSDTGFYRVRADTTYWRFCEGGMYTVLKGEDFDSIAINSRKVIPVAKDSAYDTIIPYAIKVAKKEESDSTKVEVKTGFGLKVDKYIISSDTTIWLSKKNTGVLNN